MSGRKIARMGMRGALSVWDHGFLYLLLLLTATTVVCCCCIRALSAYRYFTSLSLTTTVWLLVDDTFPLYQVIAERLPTLYGRVPG